MTKYTILNTTADETAEMIRLLQESEEIKKEREDLQTRLNDCNARLTKLDKAYIKFLSKSTATTDFAKASSPRLMIKDNVIEICKNIEDGFRAPEIANKLLEQGFITKDQVGHAKKTIPQIFTKFDSFEKIKTGLYKYVGDDKCNISSNETP